MGGSHHSLFHYCLELARAPRMKGQEQGRRRMAAAGLGCQRGRGALTSRKEGVSAQRELCSRRTIAVWDGGLLLLRARLCARGFVRVAKRANEI